MNQGRSEFPNDRSGQSVQRGHASSDNEQQVGMQQQQGTAEHSNLTDQ